MIQVRYKNTAGGRRKLQALIGSAWHWIELTTPLVNEKRVFDEPRVSVEDALSDGTLRITTTGDCYRHTAGGDEESMVVMQ